MESLPCARTHSHLSAFVPGPQEGVWRGLTGLSSVLSSGADDSLGSWSPLIGPDGVSPDTEKDIACFKAIHTFLCGWFVCELLRS